MWRPAMATVSANTNRGVLLTISNASLARLIQTPRASNVFLRGAVVTFSFKGKGGMGMGDQIPNGKVDIVPVSA